MSEHNIDENLGRLLVVTTASKFSKNEIKRLIKSKSLIQIKTSRRNSNKEIAWICPRITGPQVLVN